MSRIIGIDPGRHGAIALLEHGRLVAIVDLPYVGEKSKTRVDMVELERLLWDLIGPAMETPTFVIEEPAFMPGQRGQATASRWLGQIEGVVAGWTPTVVRCYPPVWKRHHGLLKQPKDNSRIHARLLWPTARPWLNRKKDVDRAEAALVARWHFDKITQQQQGATHG